jgi:hypothetical protein
MDLHLRDGHPTSYGYQHVLITMVKAETAPLKVHLEELE